MPLEIVGTVERVRCHADGGSRCHIEVARPDARWPRAIKTALAEQALWS